ncbi:unnamed protein product [Lathyrus sativus]|nr:unnamed protein product [Lathyrus sativus]
MIQKRKWVRKKGVKKSGGILANQQVLENSKRQLVEVMVLKVPLKTVCVCGKSKHDVCGVSVRLSLNQPEVVLDDQHRLSQ